MRTDPEREIPELDEIMTNPLLSPGSVFRIRFSEPKAASRATVRALQVMCKNLFAPRKVALTNTRSSRERLSG
jgi:hypothetical protein